MWVHSDFTVRRDRCRLIKRMFSVNCVIGL
jgi:hypothetical protein